MSKLFSSNVAFRVGSRTKNDKNNMLLLGSADTTSSIYHFLCSALCEGVTITKVIHFDVFDEVTVLLVDALFQGVPAVGARISISRRSSSCYL